MYSRIFNTEFNLAFFSPKKDQCDKCAAYHNADDEEKIKLQQEYDAHHIEKQLSRQEKTDDRSKINSLFKVACFDLQQVIPVPKGDVSSFYYKSKLSTYHFTICELNKPKIDNKNDKGIGEVYGYLWHKGEGNRVSIEIGPCLLHYLREQAENANSDNLEIVFYSDNCGGQQKNKFVISAFLYAVANFNIKSITHKFLVVGHTQNEGDAVHSIFEKQINRSLRSGPIYLPGQYASLIRTARKTGAPFKLIEMSYNDFYDLKSLTERTALNFNTNTEDEKFNFNDISVVKVEKTRRTTFNTNYHIQIHTKKSVSKTGHKLPKN